MRGRDRRRDEDETRRRFNAVWPASAGRLESTVDGWRRYDEKPADGPSPPRGHAGPHGDDDSVVVVGPDDPDEPVNVGPAPAREPARALLGAFDPGRRGLRALVAVGVVVLLFAAYLAWRSQPHAVPVAPTPSASHSVVAAPSQSAAFIVVAVQGKVAHPGLVRLPVGSRVADAIAAAGGALPGVDLSLVNLARKLTDGELLVIGLPGVAADGGGGSSGGPGTGPKVNLNTAGLTELESLPGIGPALAQHIVDYRTEHGEFHTVDDLRRVSGIGDAKFAAVKDLVTV